MKQIRKIKQPGAESQSAELLIPKVYRDIVTEELAKYRKSGANKRQLNEIKAGIAETFATSTINYGEADVRANMALIARDILGDTIELHERTESTRKAIADIGDPGMQSDAT